ncbi:hypothetical protein [Legionella jordanis]|uniref:Uncharacterized protein n=1 Tax=Legionella jordanis TaxID=456 RepID=A0A0W0VFN9_9GAMM|nr:hypothetical protein [Legionella jordanis]KTD18948.1 hypothetical protein Ljor_0171 [Legionella jordanis]RMX05489.1 hypothetical protein EAW55_02215 [Legionella jordanis]RMX19174.1 hypothetical protein EAS68_06980 [Legionella jordanis]VEH13048.1 Uncharacterised protein [Legionella jordanis]HAT8714091.1 hypothetical protein [Legionella jordanis]
MATVVKPILRNSEGTFFSPSKRLVNLVTPIQATDRKFSDFFAYVLNPIIDVGLAPVHLVDVVISLLNSVASLANAFRLWSEGQQQSARLLDERTTGELKEAGAHFLQAVSSLISALINPILSTLALATRPVASLVKAVADACDECSSSPSI